MILLLSPEAVLRWNTVAEVIGYEVVIARDPGFTEVVHSAVTEAPRLEWSGMPEGTFHWRVRGRFTWSRTGPWSPVASFAMTKELPEPRMEAGPAEIAGPEPEPALVARVEEPEEKASAPVVSGGVGVHSNFGWLHAPRAQLTVLVPNGSEERLSGGVSVAGYSQQASRGRRTFHAVPVAAIARWRPHEQWWFGADVGAAAITEHSRRSVVPFVSPAAGVRVPVRTLDAGLELGWTHLPVRPGRDAGGFALTLTVTRRLP